MPTSARHTRALVPIRLAGMEGHIRFKRHLKRSADLKNKSDLHLTNSSLLLSRQRTSCHISFSGSNITTQLNCMGLCLPVPVRSIRKGSSGLIRLTYLQIHSGEIHQEETDARTSWKARIETPGMQNMY